MIACNSLICVSNSLFVLKILKACRIQTTISYVNPNIFFTSSLVESAVLESLFKLLSISAPFTLSYCINSRTSE